MTPTLLVEMIMDATSTSYSTLTIIFTLALLLPTLYLLFGIDLVGNANTPPRYDLLVPFLTGKFNLKKDGPIGVIKDAYDNLGECFRFRLCHRYFTFFIGPDAQKFVFEAKDSLFSLKEAYSFTVPVFGPNIVYDAPGKVMMQQLKFVNRGLNHVNMEAHAGKIVQEAEDFFARWGEEGKVDVLDEFSELIILTASRCLLGEEIRNNVHNEFATLYQQFSDGMSHLSVFLPNAPTAAHRRRDEARKKISAIFTPIIANRRAHPEVVHDDFLQVLIDAKYTDDSTPTDDEIVGLLIAALFGGQHTSNITSTWLGLNIIAQKKTLVPRLLAEQKEVLDLHEGKMSLQALQEMDLLHRCMKETLRKYPPLVILMRTAMETVQYKNFTIPKGDIVAVCPPVSHRIPSIWADPEKFDPDRLAEPRNEDQVKYAFSAFGGGRHGCLGERFAFLQVKTIWSVLLRNFDFELCGEIPDSDYSSLVVGPKPPCYMRYKRKSNPYSFSSF